MPSSPPYQIRKYHWAGKPEGQWFILKKREREHHQLGVVAFYEVLGSDRCGGSYAGTSYGFDTWGDAVKELEKVVSQ